MMRWLVLAIVCSGCGRIEFDVTIDARDDDDTAVLDGADDATDAQVTSWGPPELISELVFRERLHDRRRGDRGRAGDASCCALTTVNTETRDADPWISADGNTLYFESDTTGKTALWRSRRQ